MPKYVVRCGAMRRLGVFTTSRGETCRRGAHVIARTDRGLEAGEVLCEATEAAIAQIGDPGRGQILREMTADDRNEYSRMLAMARQEFDTCQRFVDQLQLAMQLVDVEHIFG